MYSVVLTMFLTCVTCLVTPLVGSEGGVHVAPTPVFSSGPRGTAHLSSATTCTDRYYRNQVRRGILKPTTWHSVSPSYIVRQYGAFASDIHYIRIFTADARWINKKPIQLFVLHGTWAHKGADFHAWDNFFYRGVMKFAEELSRREQAPAEVFGWLWSGENTHTARLNGAMRFAEFCNQKAGPVAGYGSTYVWAHSHGCSLATIALHYVNYTFDTLFYIASPVSEDLDELYKPQGFHTLIHVYAEDDVIQYFGGFRNKDGRGYFGKPGKRVYAQQPGRRVVNVRLHINGKSSGHITLKTVSYLFWDLLDTACSDYSYHSSFDGNIVIKKGVERDIMLAIKSPFSVQQVIEQALSAAVPHRVLAMLEREYRHSGEQEKRYQKLYSRSIHADSRFADWFWESIRELGIVARELLEDRAIRWGLMQPPVQ